MFNPALNLNNIFRWEKLPHNSPNNPRKAYFQARSILLFRRGVSVMMLVAKPKGFLP